MPLSITEYKDLGASARGVLPYPEEPAIATQALDIGPTSASSLPLHPETRLVRIVADQDAFIAITDDPDATKSQRLLPAGQEQVIAVSEGLKIAVIASSTNGPNNMTSGYDSLAALITLIADPAAAKKQTAALTAEAAKLDAIKKDLIGATAIDVARSDLAEREKALAVKEAIVEALRLDLKAKRDAIKALA